MRLLFPLGQWYSCSTPSWYTHGCCLYLLLPNRVRNGEQKNTHANFRTHYYYFIIILLLKLPECRKQCLWSSIFTGGGYPDHLLWLWNLFCILFSRSEGWQVCAKPCSWLLQSKKKKVNWKNKTCVCSHLITKQPLEKAALPLLLFLFLCLPVMEFYWRACLVLDCSVLIHTSEWEMEGLQVCSFSASTLLLHHVSLCEWMSSN